MNAGLLNVSAHFEFLQSYFYLSLPKSPPPIQKNYYTHKRPASNDTMTHYYQKPQILEEFSDLFKLFTTTTEKTPLENAQDAINSSSISFRTIECYLQQIAKLGPTSIDAKQLYALFIDTLSNQERLEPEPEPELISPCRLRYIEKNCLEIRQAARYFAQYADEQSIKTIGLARNYYQNDQKPEKVSAFYAKTLTTFPANTHSIKISDFLPQTLETTLKYEEEQYEEEQQLLTWRKEYLNYGGDPHILQALAGKKFKSIQKLVELAKTQQSERIQILKVLNTTLEKDGIDDIDIKELQTCYFDLLDITNLSKYDHAELFDFIVSNKLDRVAELCITGHILINYKDLSESSKRELQNRISTMSPDRLLRLLKDGALFARRSTLNPVLPHIIKEDALYPKEKFSFASELLIRYSSNLIHAIKERNKDLVKALANHPLSNLLEFNERKPEGAAFILDTAIESGNYDIIQQVINMPAAKNILDTYYINIIRKAFKKGAIDICKMLVNQTPQRPHTITLESIDKNLEEFDESLVKLLLQEVPCPSTDDLLANQYLALLKKAADTNHVQAMKFLINKDGKKSLEYLISNYDLLLFPIVTDHKNYYGFHYHDANGENAAERLENSILEIRREKVAKNIKFYEETINPSFKAKDYSLLNIIIKGLPDDMLFALENIAYQRNHSEIEKYLQNIHNTRYNSDPY